MPTRPTRPRRTWPQRLLILVGGLVAAACGGAVLAINVAQDKASDVQRIAIGGDILAAEVTTAEPRNVLVVGIDSAAGLDPDDPRADRSDDNVLTDTMMIVRLDPAAESVAILSIPRDLWVSIGGREQKINAAVSLGGGPDAGGIGLLIDTIDDNFGIPVNNFVQVDFATFLGLVEAIDGVPFYLENPVRDQESGLLISRSGCQTVNADDALAFVRARRTFQEQIDGEWTFGQGTDTERIERQQRFVVAMIERAIAKGARNPVTLSELIDATLPYVRLDTRLTPNDLLELGDQFRTFRTENLETFTFDGLSDITPQGASALAVDLDTPVNRRILSIFGAPPLEDAFADADVAGGDVFGSASADDGADGDTAPDDLTTDTDTGLGDTDDTGTDIDSDNDTGLGVDPTPTEVPTVTPTPLATATPVPTPSPTPEIPSCS